jgi:hypothetical protein
MADNFWSTGVGVRAARSEVCDDHCPTVGDVRGPEPNNEGTAEHCRLRSAGIINSGWPPYSTAAVKPRSQ